MKSGSLLSFLALAVAAVTPAMAAEAPPILTETLERIETQVRAARQGGQAERLAELREELRQLPVPAAEAVRASRIWASMQEPSAPVTTRTVERLHSMDDIKAPRTVWSLDVEAGPALDPADNIKGPGTVWSLDIETVAPLDPDDGTKLPGTVWSLEGLELAAANGSGALGGGTRTGKYWGPDLPIATTMTREEPETVPVKTGSSDPESFEVAPPRQAHERRP